MCVYGSKHQIQVGSLLMLHSSMDMSSVYAVSRQKLLFAFKQSSWHTKVAHNSHTLLAQAEQKCASPTEAQLLAHLDFM